MHVLKDYYSKNRDNIIGTYINGMGAVARQHLTIYCWLKLMWNPDTDVDAIIDAYAKNMYGPAAKEIRELLKIQTERWEKVKWTAPKISMNAVYKQSFTKEHVKKMKKLLDVAKKKVANDPVIAKRLEYFSYPFTDFFKEAQAVHDGTGARGLTAKKVGDAPKIDGKLDDAVWKQAEPVHFQRVAKGPDEKNNAPAKYKTDLRAVWTLDGIAFAFKLAEPDVANLQHDMIRPDEGALWHQDNVELFLDVTGKNEGDFYQFIITPQPIVYDSRAGDTKWNAKDMKLAIGKEKDYWTVEIWFPNSVFPDMQKPATGVIWVGQFTRLRKSSGRFFYKHKDKNNRTEYSRMNARFGGPSANSGDFGPIKFVE